MTDNDEIEKFWVEHGGKPHLVADISFYESSWDMLMPVVFKIEELYRKAFPPNDEFIRRILAKEEPLDGPYMDVVSIPLGTSIAEVYKNIVEFIKWYNQSERKEGKV